MYDATPVALQPRLGSDRLVIEPLVIALMVILCQILANHVMERSFSEHKRLRQHFILDGAHESLAVGIEIRTPWRHEYWLHPMILEQAIKRSGEFGVPVMDQEPFAPQEPLEGIGQLPSTWPHEIIGRMGHHPRDLDLPRGKVHDEKHVISYEAVPCGDFHCEEIGRGRDFQVDPQESRAGDARLPALGCRIAVLAVQDIPDGARINTVPQV